MNYKKRAFSFLALLFCLFHLSAQEVPYGITYQAVARNVSGEELANTQVDIRFSILSGGDEGVLQYQEVHYGVATSAYGVFTAIIGNGVPVAGEKEMLRDIRWETDIHFLKIEIKFESQYKEVGTMQFLSVPYALYAARSLEPGPEGPQGPAGDPATDDQTLSFDGNNLEISGGNIVNLAALENDPDDEIQYLSLAGDSLGITNGNYIKLAEINIDDDDADPENELQTLAFNSVDSKITITDGNEIDLSPLINSDNQQLSYNPVTHELTITNGTNTIDLDDLKNDADANPANELITAMSLSGSELVINEGSAEHRVDLSSNLVAFRVEKTVSTDAPMPLSSVDFLPDDLDYNDGSGFNMGTGEFTTPINGIYSFDINYTAASSAVELYLYKNGNLFEKIGINLTSNQQVFRHKTLKLEVGDRIKLVIYTGTGLAIGTGVFSGFRVY